MTLLKPLCHMGMPWGTQKCGGDFLCGSVMCLDYCVKNWHVWPTEISHNKKRSGHYSIQGVMAVLAKARNFYLLSSGESLLLPCITNSEDKHSQDCK